MNLSGPINGLLTALIDAWLAMQRWMTGTALPALLTTLGTWGAALIEWIAPRVPGILSELGAMFGNLMQWVVSVTPDILAKLTQWGAAFADWIAPAIPILLTKLGTIWSSLVSWFTDGDKRAQIVAKLGEWGAAFADWAGGLWATLSTKLSGFWTDSLLPWFTDGEKRGQIVTKLGEWKDAFLEWAGGLWDGVAVKLGEMWGDFTDWIGDPTKRAELKDAIVEKWDGFTEWAGGVWGKIAPKLTEFAGAIKKWIEDNAPDLDSWLTSFLNFSAQVKTDFANEWPKIASTFQTNSGLIVGHIQSILDKLGQLAQWPSSTGVEMGINIAKIFNGIQTVLFAAVLAITSAIDMLITATLGAVTAMEQLKQGNLAGWVSSWGETMGQINSALAALQNSALGDISKWIDPLFWLGLRPETTGSGGGFGSNSTGAAPLGRSGGGGTININISGDGSALPADRGKLRELARAIWREAEMAGMRI